MNEAWCEEVEEVKKGLFNHFRQHFSKENMFRPRLESDFVSKFISQTDNGFLIAPFREEVREVVLSCDSSKSPSLDGFNFRFLKEYWDIYKADLIRMIEEFN